MKKRGFTHEPGAGGGHEWLTPAWIFEALGMKFDLDPCSPVNGKTFVPATQRLTKKDDGLIRPWGEGRVWLNPPYGRDIGLWMTKMAIHANGVALVTARTDTKWFHAAAPTAHALLFMLGRVDFVDGAKQRKNAASHGHGAGSVLMAWGGDSVAGLMKFHTRHHGWLVEQVKGG